MEYENLREQKDQLPGAPGVYFFIGPKREILYIGKATSLRDRVRSYFSSDIVATRGLLIRQMVERAHRVDFRQTDSVLEAVILEANLIKKHRPRYNTREKDDKSFNYLVVTNEEFPQVVTVRGKELHQKFEGDDIKYLFGPFPQGSVFKEAVRVVRKIFPWRDQKCRVGQGKPCFNRQLGLCPGTCTGEISKREYGRVVQHLRLFFEGKKGKLIERLEREMGEYAAAEQFERAAERKRQIFALQHIQDISLLKREFREPNRGDVGFRIESYDVAHISGTSTTGVMVVVEGGEAKKSDYRKFKVRQTIGGSDTHALEEILERRLRHAEWPLPNVVVVDGGMAQKNTAERVLRSHELSIPVVSVVKDERHRPREIRGASSIVTKYDREILLANAEAHRFALSYHKKLRGRLP